MTELVVVLRGEGAPAERRRTIEELERNSSDVELRVFDPEAADSRATGALEAVRSAPDTDVVLLDVGTSVAPGWWEQLRAAAYADTIVATASAVPADLLTLGDGTHERMSSAAANSVREATLGKPLWGCVYVRRDALELAMRAREAQQPGRLEELIVMPGLVHVLAGAVALSSARQAVPQLRITPAVKRTLAEVEARVDPLRVTVDLRSCAYPISGTQVHALNLVSSLASRDALDLSVLLPAVVDRSMRRHVDALPRSVRRHVVGSAMRPQPHVFHRPNQMSESDLAAVVTPGVRLVITHQDMILDRAPAYFGSLDQWASHSAASALSFVAADEIVFYSEHARREAVREGLVDEAKTSVIPPGTNHLENHRADATAPSQVDAARPFVLVIGNAYLHKNRVFALRLVDELVQAHGWDGALVFAGPTPIVGSSAHDEAALLRSRGDLAGRVVDLGLVSDATRSWLYEHAALVLYPSVYEGFGLIPFEAAASGTACVYAGRSSVAEYLPAEGAVLDLGDVPESARRVRVLLGSPDAREEIVTRIALAGQRLTWDRTADAYVDVYRRALTRPIGLSLVLGADVVVGARSQVASNETERRALLALRRSSAVRVTAEAVLAVVLRAVHLARRHRRARG